jgi:hypothetical protein
MARSSRIITGISRYLSGNHITAMGCKPTTNNETKDANNSGLKWAPQALRPLVSIILSLVSYKQPWVASPQQTMKLKTQTIQG